MSAYRLVALVLVLVLLAPPVSAADAIDLDEALCADTPTVEVPADMPPVIVRSYVEEWCTGVKELARTLCETGGTAPIWRGLARFAVRDDGVGERARHVVELVGHSVREPAPDCARRIEVAQAVEKHVLPVARARPALEDFALMADELVGDVYGSGSPERRRLGCAGARCVYEERFEPQRRCRIVSRVQAPDGRRVAFVRRCERETQVGWLEPRTNRARYAGVRMEGADQEVVPKVRWAGPGALAITGSGSDVRFGDLSFDELLDTHDFQALVPNVEFRIRRVEGARVSIRVLTLGPIDRSKIGRDPMDLARASAQLGVGEDVRAARTGSGCRIDVELDLARPPEQRIVAAGPVQCTGGATPRDPGD